MKKIITSAVVAAALTTVAFAGTVGLHSHTSMFATYSKTYTADEARDFNLTDVNGTSPAYLEYNTTATINNKNVVEVTLGDGATFGGAANDWTIVQTSGVNSGEIVATGAQMVGSTLKFIANEKTLPSGESARFEYKASVELPFTLAQGADKDISLTISGKDNENDITLDGAAASIDIFQVGDTALEPVINCADKAIVGIDSEDKSRFTAASRVTTTTVACTMNVPMVVAQNIDFDYSDVNLTVSVVGGNFSDGNFSSGLGTPGTFSDTTPTMMNNNFVTTDLNETWTYTLAGDNDLLSTTFDVQVEAKFIIDDNKTATITDADDVKDMEWELSVYKAEVLNMRSAPTNGKETFVTMYNNSQASSTVSATVTNPDGTKVSITDLGTVEKSSSLVISAADIMAKDSTIVNGFKVELYLDGVANQDGDAVAFQRSNFGQVGLRLSDNSGDTAKKGQ